MQLKQLEDVQPYLQDLADLLIDCVADGASVGFLPPLSQAEALDYWQGLRAELVAGSRVLLVALVEGRLIAAVQLSLCGKKNGLHRAEVEKLLTHTAYRRAGLGRALMQSIEQVARQAKRSLLLLDTRSDDVASALYIQQGFIEAGRIPGFALSANGSLDGTTYFYKQL